jgi:S-DNA-T family DNA segregation ATPase FtsK/SpoIIIE
MTHVDAEDAPAADHGEAAASTSGEGDRRDRRAVAPRRRADDRQSEALKREVFGIATLAVALCMLLALASFDPADLLPNGPAADTGRTANLIGPVGASIADILLRIFGLAAFLLPVTLGVPGLFFLVGKRVQVKTVDAVGYPVLVLCGAMLSHLLMGGVLVYGHTAGGLIGSTGAEVLRSLFGATGAYIIIYAVLALTFVITTRISLVTAARNMADPLKKDGTPRVTGRLSGLRRGTLDRITAWRVARADKRKEAAEARAARQREKAARDADDDAPAAKPVITDKKPGRGKKAPKAAEASGAFSLGEAGGNGVASEAFRIGGKAAAGSGPQSSVGGGSSAHRPLATEALTTLPAPLDDEELAGDRWPAQSAVDDDEGYDEEEADLEDPLDRAALAGRTDTMLSQALAPSARFDRGEPAPPHRAPGPPRRRRQQPRARGRRRVAHRPGGHAPQSRAPGRAARVPHRSRREHRPLGVPSPQHARLQRPEQVDIPPEFLRDQADRLIRALETYKIQGRVTEIHPGPVVTMFEFEPAPGVRISKIASLADDLAMAMKALKVRIVAPIPGKGVVGFEVPNDQREMVWLKEIIGDERFHSKKNMLPIALGKGIDGTPEVADLAKMPHLLVAGTTGSGKSVGVNGMITSLLYHASPDEVKFIMVDPKMLELSIYEGIPHLLLPVVTDPRKAAAALRWACDEMDRRYELMKNAGVRDIRGFNKVEGVIAPVEAAPVEPSLEDLLADGGGRRGRATPSRRRPRNWEGAFEDKPTKAALHRRRHRRVRRPHDGRRQRGRVLRRPHRPEGSRRRHPPHPRHAAPLDGRHHRRHQGELPHPHRLPGVQRHRQPHHPELQRRREPARQGRHALHAPRHRPPQARPRRVRLRRGDPQGRRVRPQAGRAPVHGRVGPAHR